MKENRLLWIDDIICSIVFGMVASFPQGILRVSLPLLTLLQEANLYQLLCILFPIWDRVGLILLLSFILQRALCFLPERFKILRYSLKRNIGRVHIVKMNPLHDSDIDSLFLFLPKNPNDLLFSCCDHLFFSLIGLFLFLDICFSADKWNHTKS